MKRRYFDERVGWSKSQTDYGIDNQEAETASILGQMD